MNNPELRQEIVNTLKSMYWVPQDRDKYLDAVEVEADALMDWIEQYISLQSAAKRAIERLKSGSK